jgi:CoA:oxalate CoA-transferase
MAQWVEILTAHKLPHSPINAIDSVIQDPNIRHRGMIAEVDQPGIGPIEISGSPFHLSETPGTVYAPAPLMGQHTAQVLSEVLGYPEGRVQELIENQAVFQDADTTGSPSPSDTGREK